MKNLFLNILKYSFIGNCLIGLFTIFYFSDNYIVEVNWWFLKHFLLLTVLFFVFVIIAAWIFFIEDIKKIGKIVFNFTSSFISVFSNIAFGRIFFQIMAKQLMFKDKVYSCIFFDVYKKYNESELNDALKFIFIKEKNLESIYNNLSDTDRLLLLQNVQNTQHLRKNVDTFLTQYFEKKAGSSWEEIIKLFSSGLEWIGAHPALTVALVSVAGLCTGYWIYTNHFDLIRGFATNTRNLLNNQNQLNNNLTEVTSRHNAALTLLNNELNNVNQQTAVLATTSSVHTENIERLRIEMNLHSERLAEIVILCRALNNKIRLVQLGM